MLEWGSVPMLRPVCEAPAPDLSHATQHMQFLHYLGNINGGLDLSANFVQVFKIVGTFTWQIRDCMMEVVFVVTQKSGSTMVISADIMAAKAQ